MKVVVILSGGIDSTTVLYDAVAEGDEVEALSFDYGQKHKKELEFAKWHCKHLAIKHKIIKLDFSMFKSSLLNNKSKSTVVPFRNGIMLAYAVGYAENIGTSAVLIGSHKGDHTIYPDCREIFTEHMNRASKEGTYNRVEIISPFNHLMKSDIVKRGLELYIRYSKTWSCYRGNKKHCGKCGTCVERLEAFKKNDKEDPVEYA